VSLRVIFGGPHARAVGRVRLIDKYSRPHYAPHLHNDVTSWRQEVYSGEGLYCQHFLTMLSQYAQSLSCENLAEYKTKLTLESGIVLPDPYAVSDSLWSNDVTAWPPLAFADIFQYFVLSTNHYSLQESKNWKSLDGYNYFANCHVQEVLLHDPGVEDWCFLLARVLPSQRQGTKSSMYTAYLVVNKKTGTISTAHCTCMAGFVLYIVDCFTICYDILIIET